MREDYPQSGDSMSTKHFLSCDVFQTSSAGQSIAGTTLNGPEFAIFDTNTSLARRELHQ